MYLTDFSLENFRNYQKVSVKFDPNVNIFIGQNAQGKTNLLEAIYFLALTRSHRTSNDHDLINFQADFAKISGQLFRSQIDLSLELRITAQGKKALINHIEQAKLSNYVGKMNTILFSPEDLNLIKGSPVTRRRFMDLEFGQINPEYLYFLSHYRQVLKQRNNYLKQLNYKQATDRVFLQVLSDQLAGLGAEIVQRRINYLKFLNEFAQESHRQISAKNEKLVISYACSVNGVDETTSTEEIYQKILDVYQSSEEKEIKLGTTLVGPHRDDLVFTIDGKDAHLYGSQGQQRTVVLSLKLAEIQLFEKITHEYPILLLDDVMSELDKTRQNALLNFIHGKTQTFITTTDLDGISWEIIKQPKIIQIENGAILPFIEEK